MKIQPSDFESLQQDNVNNLITKAMLDGKTQACFYNENSVYPICKDDILTPDRMSIKLQGLGFKVTRLMTEDVHTGYVVKWGGK